MRRLAVSVAAILLIAACRGTHSRKAVEQAVQDHVNQNSHLVAGSFNTKIESVTFKGDTADAVVKFESKQSASLFVEVRYGLRLENGRWEVFSSTPMSGQGGDSHAPAEGSASTPAGTQPASPPLQPSH